METAAIDLARQAVAMRKSRDYSSLHTLAALYAERGQVVEARATLLEAMEAGGRAQPGPNDWYVLGRIAEHYGARDVALAAYRRERRPDRESRSASYTLAQRRIASLATSPERAPAGAARHAAP